MARWASSATSALGDEPLTAGTPKPGGGGSMSNSGPNHVCLLQVGDVARGASFVVLVQCCRAWTDLLCGARRKTVQAPQFWAKQMNSRPEIMNRPLPCV